MMLITDHSAVGVLFLRLSVITVYKLTDVPLAAFAFVSSSTMHETIKSMISQTENMICVSLLPENTQI